MATYAAFLRDTGVDGTSIGVNLQKQIEVLPGAYNPNAGNGQVYWVASFLGLDTNDGLSPDRPIATLSVALALSHAYIAAGGRGYCRNTIYVQGGQWESGLTENLTNLAQKTDIVGIGNTDSFKGARIAGHHTITGTTWMGCAFYNIAFAPDGAEPCITLPTGNDGIEFHNCCFEGTPTNTTGILSTANQNLVVENCRFIGQDFDSCFSTACIYIGTGNNNSLLIRNNTMLGGRGIQLHATQTGVNIWAIKNFIRTSGVTIDDDSNTLLTADNRCISSDTLTNAINVSEVLAVGNIVAGNDDTTWIKDIYS